MTGDVTGPKFRRGFPFREALQEAIAQTGNPRGDAQLAAASRRLDRWVPGRTAGSKDVGDEGLYAAFRSCLETARLSHLNESLVGVKRDDRERDTRRSLAERTLSRLASRRERMQAVTSALTVISRWNAGAEMSDETIQRAISACVKYAVPIRVNGRVSRESVSVPSETSETLSHPTETSETR